MGCGGGGDETSPSSASSDTGTEAVGAKHFRFVDVAAEAGLTRVFWAGRPGKDHLLDSLGSGAAFLDYDGDGRLDIYLVNAWRMEGDRIAERGRNALYRGRPDGTFLDVTEEAGVDGAGHWGSGAFAADFDRDGRCDILVTNFGPNLLYRNRGDGTFENVAPRLGIEAPGWNTGAAWFDADGDSDLDLYISRYIDCTLEEVLGAERSLDWKGVDKVAFGPFGLQGAADLFFRSDGGKSFADRTREAGFEDKARGFGLGVRAADFDGDGDVDVYVANDSDPNYLYRNEGDGTFEEVGLWSGCALSSEGAAQAGMGIAVGDVTGKGRLDIFVTHFAEDYSTFYRNVGGGFFEDATAEVGLAAPTFTPLSWGAALADLDNDGDLDLAMMNGHIYPQVDLHPEFGFRYAQRNVLLENRDGTFHNVTEDAGDGFRLEQCSRGLAVGDYDDDGDLDLLVTNLDAPPALLRNESACGSWITIVCEVPPGSGPRIGSSVTVTAQGRTRIRDLACGDSFLSTHDFRLHFGLGDAERVEKVDVRWPDGTHTVREDVPARQFLVIRKDS